MFGVTGHVHKAQAQLPIVSLQSGYRLDLELGGKLLGYSYKKIYEEAAERSGSAFSLLEFQIGFSGKYKDKASLDAGVKTSLEYRDGDLRPSGNSGVSAPITAHAKLQYKPKKRMNLYTSYEQVHDEGARKKDDKRSFVGFSVSF